VVVLNNYMMNHTTIPPAHLVLLTHFNWKFRCTKMHDGKDLYLQIEAKSPKPILSDWFIVAESRHLSHDELFARLTIDSCIAEETKKYAEEYWSRHKTDIEKSVIKALMSGESSVTIDLN
jgi:hypothetical protein